MTGNPRPLPPPDEAPFRCVTLRDHDAARILLFGDLDIAATPILAAEIEAMRAAGCRRVVVDLGGLDFIDSTGLRSLLEFDAESRRDGFTLSLVPGSDGVQRIFELTGTRKQLPFVDS